MMNPESKTIDYQGIKVRYYIQGSGYPMLLLHGWGCSASTLSSIAKTSVNSGYKCLSVDFPGFGASDEPASVWGTEDYTKLLEAIVKEECVKNPVLLGHSFGGRVAIKYASRNNARSLILVDAAGIKPKRSLSYYRKVYSYKLLKYFVLMIMGKKKGNLYIDNIRKKRGSSDYALASPRMRQILSKVVNEDLKTLLPSIKSPTLLIWGENDTATPLSDAKTMEKLIPDAGLVNLKGAGHYSFLDSPHQFHATLQYFLSH